MSRILAGVAALVIALSAGPGFAQVELAVWWIKGFYKGRPLDTAVAEQVPSAAASKIL